MKTARRILFAAFAIAANILIKKLLLKFYQKNKKNIKLVLTFPLKCSIIMTVADEQQKSGPVVQLVRTLACHARGRGFEPHPGRQLF